MPPRWIRTKDYQAAEWKPRHPDDDWLLISGQWVVGRVLPAEDWPSVRRYAWSLTGPHMSQLDVPTGGEAEDVEAAMDALLATWRRWQQWAGVRDA